jgi:hypothetical protein
VSPIFVRPVREQLEHDRLIRFLQAKYKRKSEVGINTGDEQVAPVKVGANMVYPDLVLTTGKKLAGVVEVESAESVNNLEAMAEWVHYSRARVPFHLYVPVQAYDAARRLADANHVTVAELWTYRPTTEGFDLVRMFHDASASSASGAKAAASKAASKKAASKPPKPAKKTPAKTAGKRVTKKAAKPTKPARGNKR